MKICRIMIVKNKRFVVGWLRDYTVIVFVWGLTLISVSPVALHAETKSAHSKEWLGAYIGSQIPGYEVKKSTSVQVSGWQSVDQMIKAEGKRPLSADLVDTCKADPAVGIALINIRSIIALGPVPGPRTAPNTYISNGMYREYEADCVIEAVPLGK